MVSIIPTMDVPTYRRPIFEVLMRRVRERRRFLQILAGPRQVGKTTLARQVLDSLDFPSHYASADDPGGRDRTWVEGQWDLGRLKAGEGRRGGLLVLDEVQKVPEWSEVIKRLWDEDTSSGVALRVLLLGSAPLLLQRGLSESLGGRFEMVHVRHWSLGEMGQAFRWDLDRYLFFGGYPGAAPLVRDRARWSRYILDSLVETSLSRDILLLTRVDKPALLRQLFRLACDYSGRVLSFTKMVGQLQDAGNTTTLAHYLDLLGGAGLITGLQRFSGSRVRQRGSSPKLLVLNTALMTAASGLDRRSARRDTDFWGRLVESAVGAHLVNSLAGSEAEVLYWRERNREVDYVLRRGQTVVPIEVSSGRRKDSLPGLAAFGDAYSPRRRLLVGGQGIPLAEFLDSPAKRWLK
jgi:hypothetical protein